MDEDDRNHIYGQWSVGRLVLAAAAAAHLLLLGAFRWHWQTVGDTVRGIELFVRTIQIAVNGTATGWLQH